MAGKQPTIQNFIASMNRSGGFARTNRYAVVISPPRGLALFDSSVNSLSDVLISQDYLKTTNRQVNLHCSAVSMPGHDLQAKEQQHGSAPGRQIVQSHDYEGTIAATFYLDSHLRERHFFEQWQRSAVNTQTHKANYYDDYIGTMDIYQLDGNGEITYGIKATEVYPTLIAGIEYAYANSNQIATQVVQFQYRQWYNLTSDEITGYSSRLDLSQESTNAVTGAASDLAQKISASLGIEKGIAFEREKKRQEQLRKPEIDRQTFSARNSLTENKRQEQLRSPEVDRSLKVRTLSSEIKRQEQLRTPEIDRQGNSRRSGIKESKRQEQLRSPTSN